MFNFKYTYITLKGYVKFKVIPPKYKDSKVYGNKKKFFKPYVITDYVGKRIGWASDKQLRRLLGKIRYTKVVVNWSKEETIERYLERCDLTIIFSELLNTNNIKWDKEFKKWLKK